jgi:gas vesicle protein
MSGSSKIILGILGAAAAGVVIGLLVAPETGSDMRARIKKTTDSWADQLSNLFTNMKEDANDMREDIEKEMPQGA